MSGQNAPPDFRQRLENTNSRQGQPVKLIAVVTGNPTPVVQWYREGKCLTLFFPNISELLR